MTRSHNEPDFEAEKVSITADRIRKDEKKFRRTGDHNAQKMQAKGNAEITITHQYPGKDNRHRPPAGTVIRIPGAKAFVEITARHIEKHKEKKDRRDTAIAEKGVRIFKNRRSRP